MYHIIVNPASRSGKGRKIWENKIKPFLEKESIPYKIYMSTLEITLADLAAQIERENPEGEVTCILMGGDGTLNQFIQGFTDTGRITIGLISCGSGNDLARDLKLPSNPVKALRHIVNTGSSHSMDLGTITFDDGISHRFFTSTGIGFDAAVCEEVDRTGSKKFLNRIGLGKLIYLRIALKQLFGLEAFPCTITCDDKDPVDLGDILFIAGMNHRYEGGGFMFGPGADANDGILNLCVVKNIKRRRILYILPTAFKGKHFRFEGIESMTASTYRIQCQNGSWVHTDGEVRRLSDSFTVTCHKDAIHMIY